MPTSLTVFCCSVREDEEMLEHLKKHLTPLQKNGQISLWSDTDLDAGVEWKKELHQYLEKADIILLLISPDFMASDYCYSTEMERAIERHNEGGVIVIPILLRSTHWEDAPFAQLQVVPTKIGPVTSWPNQDDAFNDITKRISRVITRLQTKQDTSSFLPQMGQREREKTTSLSAPLESGYPERTTPTSTFPLVQDEERYVSFRPEHTLAELLRQLAADQSNQTMQEAYGHLDLLTKTNIEQALGTLLDPMAFPDLQKFADGLERAYGCVKNDSVNSEKNLVRLVGAIGLVCFTLQLLHMAQEQNHHDSSADLSDPQRLLKEPAVRYWFKEVYAPSQDLSTHQHTQGHEDTKLGLAKKHWQDLDFDSLELYQLGTTSFILRCQIPLLVGERLVLKCLLFPYTRIPAIIDATRSYCLPPQEKEASTRVRVLSSTGKWILMDFIDGSNLREFLLERRKIEGQQPPHLRTDLLISLGKPLLAALTSLSRTGLHHEDLTPSNIIVHQKSDTHKSIDRITLIDIGRNYLYTRHVGIERNREAFFVAPEVKKGQKTEDTSDLYSFGMILIELADPLGVQGQTIPDSLYQYAPYLARFIEDLIDEKPANRRLIFHMKDPKDPYADLYQLFEDLLSLLPSEQEVKPRRFSRTQPFFAFFYHGRQLKHTWELWRKTRSSSTHSEIAEHTGWLYVWLVVSRWTCWAIFGFSLIWGARDLGISPFLPPYISIPQTWIRGCGSMCLPFQNLFYSYGVQNLPMRGVGLSIGLVQSAYYPNILAGLTTWSMRGKLARATGWCLRLQTFIAFPVIVIGNLVQPGWWLALLIIGLPVPTLVNIFCYKLATRTLKIARTTPTEISTVPPGNDPLLKSFGSWGAMLFAYMVVLCGIWTGLHFDKLSDVWSYTGIIVVVNVLVLCISKSIIQAPAVRGSLSRAFTLGERLEALDKKSRKNISKP